MSEIEKRVDVMCRWDFERYIDKLLEGMAREDGGYGPLLIWAHESPMTPVGISHEAMRKALLLYQVVECPPGECANVGEGMVSWKSVEVN